MTKRLFSVAVVVGAFFVLAVPALAFNGFRDTYVLTGYCSTCHYDGGLAQPVYDEWAETAHSRTQTYAISRGAGCATCHVGNYSPAKHIPTVSGSYGFPTEVVGTQGSGMSGFSENFVGCSSCHVGVNTGPNATINDIFGSDPANTGHIAPTQNMANADICGQCHARYSATVASYDSWTWPTASPSPVATTVNPQGTLGDFNPLGAAPGWTPDPITDYLDVATKDNPVGNEFWEGGQSAKAHGEGAVQYEEWMVEGHAGALTGLTSQPFWAFLPEDTKKGCLECHSTDFVMMEEAGETPASTDAKYGVTCVGCHKPHEEGSQHAVWNEEKNPQLKMSRQKLCVTCHNGDIPVGEEAEPGDEIHHPMKEMIDGYGAIDVDGIPSVHKGRCVQCHMVPTGYEHDGAVATAGNHVFAIVTPEEAASQRDSSDRAMPYSSCSTCHEKPNDPLATYLDETIVDRQEWTIEKIELIWGLLDTAAGKFGFADAEEAHEAIVAVPAGSRTTNQTEFLKAFTNVEFVETEGSFGIHNWLYTNRIVNKTIAQARSVALDPWVVTIARSRGTVRRNQQVRFSGTVKTSSMTAGTGRVTLQRRKGGGAWRNWTTATLNASGAYARTLRMTARGTWYVRAQMPGNANNLTAFSGQVRVRVR